MLDTIIIWCFPLLHKLSIDHPVNKIKCCAQYSYSGEESVWLFLVCTFWRNYPFYASIFHYISCLCILEKLSFIYFYISLILIIYTIWFYKMYFQVKRTLGQFTPAQWDKDEWHPLLGPWRFIQVLTLCVVFLTVELNTFFLKFCLWIPPRNPVIVYRLILWWLIAIPTIREYNSYLQDRYFLSLSLCRFYCSLFQCTYLQISLVNENLWYAIGLLHAFLPSVAFCLIFSEIQWRRLAHFVGFLLLFVLLNFLFASNSVTVSSSPSCLHEATYMKFKKK